MFGDFQTGCQIETLGHIQRLGEVGWREVLHRYFQLGPVCIVAIDAEDLLDSSRAENCEPRAGAVGAGHVHQRHLGLRTPGGHQRVEHAGQRGQVVVRDDDDVDVVIMIDVSDANEVATSPTALFFTPTNWDQPQDVTVSGVDDFRIDGDKTMAVWKGWKNV